MINAGRIQARKVIADMIPYALPRVKGLGTTRYVIFRVQKGWRILPGRFQQPRREDTPMVPVKDLTEAIARDPWWTVKDEEHWWEDPRQES